MNEKFFLETVRSDGNSIILRNSKELMVSVALPVEKKQDIHVYMTKHGNLSTYGFPPKTDEYTIVKPTSKEEFYKQYNTCLRYIQQPDRREGSFYLVKWYGRPASGMAWFSGDEKSKMSIRVEFHDNPKDFFLSVETVNSWKGIQHFRKAGNFVDSEQFNGFYLSVLNFLHDTENYTLNYKSLVEQFKSVVEGETPELPMNPVWQVDNSLAMEKLSSRITAIERRLIELDTDTAEERIKMRVSWRD